MSTLKLSVVVVAYNMARELPRTLLSLSPACQRDIEPDDYEIIVVDNGSTPPCDPMDLQAIAPNLCVHVMTDASPSPARAINEGLALARGELIGVCIDGARMATPRLLATALEAARLHPRPVIGTLAFHLGPDLQSRSIRHGYDQAAEDALLDSVDWVADGYQLFGISVWAASSGKGWFTVPSETNALFLSRMQWDALDGYDAAFEAPGGGLVNLDTWARACADPQGRVMLLLGEATFHQVHGGVATNSIASPWNAFHDEYVRIRGRAYASPRMTPFLYGQIPPAAWPSLANSLAAFSTNAGHGR